MKTDIRIIKTKQAIEGAFLDLVEKKGYKNVKLIDIAEKARVNRNTIYLHYASKEGIVEEIIKDKVSDGIEGFDLIKIAKSRNNRRKIEELYKAIFNIFGDNIELYRILLTDENLVGFLYMEIDKIKKLIIKAFKDSIKNEVGVDFILNGVFGVLKNYTVYAKGTADENIKLLTDFTIINLRRLVYSY